MELSFLLLGGLAVLLALYIIMRDVAFRNTRANSAMAGLAMFAVAGRINATPLSLLAAGLVALPVGFLIGEQLFRYVDTLRLRPGIVAMLLLSLAFVVFR